MTKADRARRRYNVGPERYRKTAPPLVSLTIDPVEVSQSVMNYIRQRSGWLLLPPAD